MDRPEPTPPNAERGRGDRTPSAATEGSDAVAASSTDCECADCECTDRKRTDHERNDGTQSTADVPSGDHPTRAADGARAGRTRANGRRRWLTIAGTVVVLVAGGIAAARTIDPGAALASIWAADPRLLTAAALAYAASWPLRGRRYADILRPTGHRLGAGFCTAATFLSQAANLAIPARAGDGVRAYLCKRRREVPYATGVASLAIERAFDLFALAALGGVAAGTLTAFGDLSLARGSGTAPVGGPAAVALTASTVALATVALLTCRRRGLPAVPRRVAARVPDGLLAVVRDVAGALGAVGRDPRALAAIAGGSLAVWLLDALTAVLVLAAVSGDAPATLVLVGTLAVCAGNLAKVLPLTQGGLGLYEGAFAATVVALSPVGGAVALAAAVLDHALKNVLTLIGGALAAAALHTSPSALRDEAAPVDP